MRVLVIAAVAVAACGLALGQSVPAPGGGGPIYPVIVGQQEEPAYGGGPLPSLVDADRDGYAVALDCNDDNPMVNPAKLEVLNGIDDDCNGVLDDGFDTTFDWPQLKMAMVVWPAVGAAKGSEEAISSEAEPRVVWAGDRFMAVWIDVRSRLRLARITTAGTLQAPPDYLRKGVRAVDVAWTGTRLGIVYEDNFLGTPSVRLMLVDREGVVQNDVILAAFGTQPKIAWGQDRFGVVWKSPGGTGKDLRFQRFDPTGEPLSPEEVLDNSGSNASIAFSGTTIVKQEGGKFDVYEGWFGIVHEAYQAFGASGTVLLSAWPREAGASDPLGPFTVNQHEDPETIAGAMPTIAGNPAGFAVAWHASENGLDAAQMRFFSLSGLAPVQEFTPDADLGRYGRMTWTGSEFVMANDNRTTPTAGEFDVHFRRVDPSGNTHLAAGWGPWAEVRLRDTVKGALSTHPDVANFGEALGIVWVEADSTFPSGGGRLWLAFVTHK